MPMANFVPELSKSLSLRPFSRIRDIFVDGVHFALDWQEKVEQEVNESIYKKISGEGEVLYADTSVDNFW
jgi:hypothetical protein